MRGRRCSLARSTGSHRSGCSRPGSHRLATARSRAAVPALQPAARPIELRGTREERHPALADLACHSTPPGLMAQATTCRHRPDCVGGCPYAILVFGWRQRLFPSPDASLRCSRSRIQSRPRARPMLPPQNVAGSRGSGRCPRVDSGFRRNDEEESAGMTDPSTTPPPRSPPAAPARAVRARPRWRRAMRGRIRSRPARARRGPAARGRSLAGRGRR